MASERTAAKPHTRVYWDSCLYTALFRGEAEHLKTLRGTINAAKLGSVKFVASALVLCEATGRRLKDKPLTTAAKHKVVAAFDNDYVEVVALSRRVAEKARELSWRLNLHPRDAAHLATAILSKCSFFESTDEDFMRIREKVSEIVIRLPEDVVSRELWDEDGRPALPESDGAAGAAAK